MPSWIVVERQSHMQIDDIILKCTAFVGVPTEQGFHAEGTAFFVSVTQRDLDFYYVVTCRHVIKNFRETAIWIRVNRKDKPPLVIESAKSEWVGHPESSVDISVWPFDLRRFDADDELDIGFIPRETDPHIRRISEHYGFSLGVSVFIVGAFTARIGERSNIPIVRFGNIAAMPSEPIPPYSRWKPAFLIETRSLGGTSGSPVFFHTAPERLPAGSRRGVLNRDTGEVPVPYILIGMIISNHAGSYVTDFAANGADDPGSDDRDRVLPPGDSDFNAGISVALPVSHIFEALDHPGLQSARDATMEADLNGRR